MDDKLSRDDIGVKKMEDLVQEFFNEVCEW